MGAREIHTATDDCDHEVKWIQEVLGTKLWETQKHLIEAYTSGKPLCIHRGHVPRDQNLALVNWLTALFVQSGRGTADPIADLKLWNELFNKSPQPVTSFWMSNGLAKQVYEAAAKLRSRERAKYKRVLGVDPAGNAVDCSVSVMRHEDGTLYHEGKDYEVRDGVIHPLPGGRLQHDHGDYSVGYTWVIDEASEMASKKKRPPLHNPQPWNPPVAKRRKR